MSSGNESDAEPMSTNMLEDIHDGIQSHPSIDRRNSCYKICDRIEQRRVEQKGALLPTRNMEKYLQKFFKDMVNEIS